MILDCDCRYPDVAVAVYNELLKALCGLLLGLYFARNSQFLLLPVLLCCTILFALKLLNSVSELIITPPSSFDLAIFCLDLQVREIASDPDSFNVFVTSFDDIQSIGNDIKGILCDRE